MAGSQPSHTEKISINSMPSAKEGNEMPETASVIPRRSGARFRQTAEAMPMPIPNTTDHAMLAMVSSRVGMKRSPISTDTGRLERIDVPKSPRSALRKKRANCRCSGRSSPRSCRTMRDRKLVRFRTGRQPRRIAGQQVHEPEHQHGHDHKRGQQAEQAFAKIVEHESV